MDEQERRFPERPRLHLLLLVLLGLLVYSNTFDSPFQFDDYIFVEYREVEAKVAEVTGNSISINEMRGPWASRPLLYATFVLNHLMGNFDTWGYHMVNIALHLANGILLYFLVIVTGKHLGREDRDIIPVALLSALIFVLHPIQTETVTMVINRSMLLATTFYLAGILLFLKAALSEGGKKDYYIIGLLVASLLGASSREDFITFPLMLLIYDLFFVSRFRLRDLAGRYKEYVAVLPGIALMGYLALTNTYDKYADFAGHELPSDIFIPPLQYALTQFKVHWTYIRLLLFPVNQNLDYIYPLSKRLFDLPTMLSFLGYVALWAVGIVLARKKPVVSFGLLWFLIVLLPISFAITLVGLRLGNPIFEHRLYLPSVGPIVLAALAFAHLARKRRALVAALAVFCMVLGGAAYARNSVWSDVGTLWSDVLKKSPHSRLGLNNYAVFLLKKKHIKEAVEDFQTALRLWPNDGQIHANLGAIYVSTRNVDEAIEELTEAIKLAPYLWYPHVSLGAVYASQHKYEEALEHYLAAAEIEPWNAEALNRVAETYYALDQKEKAIEYYIQSLWFDNKQSRVLNNLGMLFMETEQNERAIKHLEPLVKLEPNYVPARIALGKLYIKIGLPFKAIEHLEAARKLRPNEPEIERTLAEAYRAEKEGQTLKDILFKLQTTTSP